MNKNSSLVGHSNVLQTLEKCHHLARSVGATCWGVEVPTFHLWSGAPSNLGSELELSHGGLAGDPPVLGEQRDDQPFLGAPLGLRLGVELADQLLGAVRSVQSLHESHDGAEVGTSCRPSGPELEKFVVISVVVVLSSVGPGWARWSESQRVINVWSQHLTAEFV